MTSLVRPIITEKSLQDAQQGRFTFEVQSTAPKSLIKAEVQELFGVHVEKIATIRIHGRTVRIAKTPRKKLAPVFKKAIVTLKKGETISYFEQKA